MSSEQNLQDAFAGESQANRKYLAFAKKADQEGLPNVAKLFRAAAAAETVHAHAHLRALGGIKSTAENLKEAVEGERYEFQEMYPGFIETAEAEDNKKALISFKNANTVEETHHGLYSEASASVDGGSDLPDRKIYVCEICGHTHYDGAPEKCPVCSAPQTKLFEVE